MKAAEVLDHLQKGGIFGGIVLVPVAIAAQSFSIEALVICALGFCIYIAGLAVFAGNPMEESHPEFSRSGKVVCSTAYLIATLSATSIALSPGAKGEIVSRFTKDVAVQVEALAAKPGKSVQIVAPGPDESLQRMTLVAGSVDKSFVRLAPLAIVSEPFLGGIIERINSAITMAFLFSLAVSVIAILFGVFLAPRLPTPKSIRPKGR
jgi:hypothetical protein